MQTNIVIVISRYITIKVYSKKIDLIIRSIFFVVIELNIYMPTYAFDLNGNVTVDRWNINTYSYVFLALCC